jgi:hypothetical protein
MKPKCIATNPIFAVSGAPPWVHRQRPGVHTRLHRKSKHAGQKKAKNK